ncbi:LIM domain only protein 7-like [Xyrauchen texanus]|uniref:LIM domain only protein 7-like n=1 Tax=Xyrauchen texanus TaxID=154827 RepID=UPI00224195DC|nr:LIM domain only protein 7-like [Xyrauchen texanus]
MEWRQQSAVSCELAFHEAQRWLEEVTKNRFGSKTFRVALEDGILLCDLINTLKPGIIKRVNRLTTPIAGLDNVNVFLKACEKLGLNESQLFHPGDLQDVSNRVTVRREETSRRLKNVLITIYWLGRKAQADPFYTGPQLNLKAFEGLLGIALSKALEESVHCKSSVRDSGYAEGWFSDREDLFSLKQPGYRREDSVESLDSVESRTLSLASDSTLRAGSEGCFSDAEAEHCFRMADGSKGDFQNRERMHIPSALRKKRVEHLEGRGYTGPLISETGRGLCHDIRPASALLQWASSYQSDSDSDHPEPDLKLDDLASRRFHSVNCVAPMNFAIPLKPRRPKETPIGIPSTGKSWLTLSDASRLAAMPPQRSNQRLPIRRSRYIGSKSMGDITLEPIPQESDNCSNLDLLGSRHVHQRSVGELTLEPSAMQRVQQEQLQSIQVRMRESEAKWHDDLSRWKNRRRSTNSDLHRKQEEVRVTSWGGTSAVKTAPLFGVPEESAQETTGCHMLATQVQPYTRATDPFYTKCTSRRSLSSLQPATLGERTHLGSLTSDQAFIPVAGSSHSSSSSMPGPMSNAGYRMTSTGQTRWSTTSTSPLTDSMSSGLTSGTHVEMPDTAQRSTSEFFIPPAAAGPEQSSPTSLTFLDQEQQDPDLNRCANQLENFYAGGTQNRMAATLPRGFRRSEGCSRLSTGVTPRPFGAKPSKVSLLPRVYAMDDSHTSLMSGQRDQSLIPSFLSGQGKLTASADMDHSHLSNHPIHTRKEEVGEERDERSSGPPIQSFVSKVTVAASLKQSPVASESKDVKVGQSEIRVCLNQKPNSRRDFGFQAHWDSTGARVKSVQAGSPAEQCGLRMGDEIVALGRCRVGDMNYEQFKDSMDTAQQKGSLLMDIRRHGQNDWGIGHPSLPYKSHKTINLTSDNSTLVGRPEHYMSISTNSNSPAETVAKTPVNGQPANGVPSKMVNISFRDNPVALRNKGGSESDISDLQVPSISASSSGWSWDHEEERRRQEKWQMEQELLLQEKYRRDQEKLEEEWRRAQQEVYEEELRGPEEQKTHNVMSNGNAAPYIPPPFNQSTASNSVAPSQHTEKVGITQNRQTTLQIAAGHHSQKAETECDSTTKNQWPEESYGFAKLTVSDRTKSKSTPTLESLHKQDAKGSGKKGQLSQAENERLQILEEMRKKTPLLTDSSWIRQRSTGINKEPITLGTPIRRFESMDNLHSSNSWSRQSYSSGIASRPHSARGSTTITYRSGRSSLGPGSAIFSTGLKQSSFFASNSPTPPITASTEPLVPESCPNSQQRGRRISLYLMFNPRLISGRRMCSRCEQPLGKGAAMVIDSLELCFHIGCFKCVSCRTDLGRGAESGAQVRVRHRQLLCNNCYCRLRVCSTISK